MSPARDTSGNRVREAVLSRLLPSAALLAGPLGLVAPAGAKALPTGCPATLDLYTASPAALAACGVKSFPLRAVKTLPDGGKEFSYLLDGVPVTQLLPPASFDAGTASAAQLRRYGIAPEPPATARIARARWRSMVSNIHFVTPPEEMFQVPVKASPPVAPHPLIPAPPTHGVTPSTHGVRAQATSLNWSGDVINQSGHSFTTADDKFIQPAANSTTCANNSAVFWSGIGGVNTNNLAQDGTALNLEPLLGQGQAWWEILPASVTPVNLFATAGQSFEANTSYLGNGTWDFFLKNDFTGASTDIQSSGAYDGSTLEFISERPDVNGSLTNLTNFGTTQWQSASADGKPLKDWSQTEIDMVSNNGSHDLATGGTSSLGSGSFVDTWIACS
jgi:hypothetical protein